VTITGPSTVRRGSRVEPVLEIVGSRGVCDSTTRRTIERAGRHDPRSQRTSSREKKKPSCATVENRADGLLSRTERECALHDVLTDTRRPGHRAEHAVPHRVKTPRSGDRHRRWRKLAASEQAHVRRTSSPQLTQRRSGDTEPTEKQMGTSGVRIDGRPSSRSTVTPSRLSFSCTPLRESSRRTSRHAARSPTSASPGRGRTTHGGPELGTRYRDRASRRADRTRDRMRSTLGPVFARRATSGSRP